MNPISNYEQFRYDHQERIHRAENERLAKEVREAEQREQRKRKQQHEA